MTKCDALRAARDELVRTPSQIVAANETAVPFTHENNQPLAAIVVSACCAQKSISCWKQHRAQSGGSGMSALAPLLGANLT
jgi:hypothetical protein